jgi:hypothetical protein
MIIEFESVIRDIDALLEEWEFKLSELSNEVITGRKNSQNRTIKQILGHLIVQGKPDGISQLCQ